MNMLSTLPRCTGLLLLFGIFFLSTSAWAQMPGMEPPKKAEPAADTVVMTPQSGTASVAAHQADGTTETEQATGVLTRQWTRYMGVDSPYRSLILVILTLLVLLNLKAYLMRIMRKTLMKEQAFLEENRDREGPRGLPPPTPPGIRITYQGGSVDCSGPCEASRASS